MQSISDDSASQIGDRRLYLAGYLNFSGQWALFADAWAEELAAAPSITHLKMVEAQNLRGPFKNWGEGERDAKIRSLARVIRHFRPTSFEVSVSREDFDALVKPYAPYGLATPYLPCLFGVVSMVSRTVNASGSKLPIEFIFDEQHGVGADFLQNFAFMCRNLPRGARRLIKGSPTFKDDKHFLPLQAADMLVWHIRRERDDGLPQFGSTMGELIRGEHHVVTEITKEMLEHWGHFFARQPGVHLVKTKPQWKKFRVIQKDTLASGYIPPHGSRWKNFIYGLRERVARIFRA